MTDYSDLIASAHRDISDADRCDEIGVMPAVHQLHRRLRQVTKALADSVPREQYDAAWAEWRKATADCASAERERDEARAERDALDTAHDTHVEYDKALTYECGACRAAAGE